MRRILRDAGGGGIAGPEVEKSLRGRKGVEKTKKKIKQSCRQGADDAVVPAPIAHEADVLVVVAMGRTPKTGENDDVSKTRTSTRIAPKVAHTINLGGDDDQSLQNTCWMIYEKPQVLSRLLWK
jgi:hypothetical protein